MRNKNGFIRNCLKTVTLICCISAAPHEILAQRTAVGASMFAREFRANQTRAEPGNDSKCKEWSAWYKAQSTGPKTLHVSATCTFFTAGYEVKLKPRTTHDIDAEVYVFDLSIIPPKGVGPISRVIRHIPVNYIEQTEHRYYLVKIEPDHITIPVKVIE